MSVKDEDLEKLAKEAAKVAEKLPDRFQEKHELVPYCFTFGVARLCRGTKRPSHTLVSGFDSGGQSGQSRQTLKRETRHFRVG